MDKDRAVYRECRNESCPAYRLDLPHSHFEFVRDSTTDRLSELKSQWDTEHTLNHMPVAREIMPTIETSPVRAWLSLPLEDLMQKVGEYITWVETGITAEVCKCERIPHPTQANTYKGETSLDCPAHSKEGLVLGFITWLTSAPSGLLPDTAMGDTHGD